jgi:DNA (cytosine-5)-methyltransferase 1
MVGFRHDLGVEWAFPKATHSHDALLRDQWVTGEYWERHGVSKKRRPALPAVLEPRLRRLKQSSFASDARPWATVRDALVGLPDPEHPDALDFPDHRFQPGARTYPGHTGSPLDSPAKTLKAGDHGVPGGENMLVKPDGQVRYFTIRESARIQTVPDGYRFHGSWTETMRQLGNAVPVLLAQTVASSVAQRMIEAALSGIKHAHREGRSSA